MNKYTNEEIQSPLNNLIFLVTEEKKIIETHAQ